MRIIGKKPVYLVTIYSLLMFLAVLVNITVTNGNMEVVVNNVFELFKVSKAQALIQLFYFIEPVILIFVVWVFGKSKIKALLIPFLCPIFITVVAAIYYGIRFNEWDIIIDVGFRFGAYIIIFVLWILVALEKLENKKILTIICFLFVFVALALFFAGRKPFVNGEEIFISKLLFFISYCLSVACLNMGIDKDIEENDFEEL